MYALLQTISITVNLPFFLPSILPTFLPFGFLSVLFRTQILGHSAAATILFQTAFAKGLVNQKHTFFHSNVSLPGQLNKFLDVLTFAAFALKTLASVESSTCPYY